jgi:hypothetical protein
VRGYARQHTGISICVADVRCTTLLLWQAPSGARSTASHVLCCASCEMFHLFDCRVEEGWAESGELKPVAVANVAGRASSILY